MKQPSSETPLIIKNLWRASALAATVALAANCSAQPEFKITDNYSSVSAQTGAEFFAEQDLTGESVTVDTQAFPATQVCIPGINSPYPEAIKNGTMEVNKPNQEYDITTRNSLYSSLPYEKEGYVHPGQVFGLKADRLTDCTDDPQIHEFARNDDDGIIWFKEGKNNSPVGLYGYPKG